MTARGSPTLILGVYLLFFAAPLLGVLCAESDNGVFVAVSGTVAVAGALAGLWHIAWTVYQGA